MPRQKNFKRLVRSRMARTGESYTAARSRFEPSAPDFVADPDAAALARALKAMSGSRLKNRNSNKCLVVRGTDNNAQAVQYDCHPEHADQWWYWI